MRVRHTLRKIGILVVFSLLVQSVAPALAAPRPFGPAPQKTIITPETIHLELNPGSCSLPITLTVQTAPAPIPEADVLFVFDVTGSMRYVLEQAKARGLDIMKELRSKVEDSAFGVASFCDYPGHYDYGGYSAYYGARTDYPWALDADITSDIAAIQKALESLALHDGEDGPEDYSRALFETMYVGWRPGAKRIVVLFGDAPTHDMEFYRPFGENFGVDPGLDGEAGTEDDLKFVEVVEQVKERGIQVIPVNCDLERREIVRAGFDYIAQQTGGQVYPLEDAGLLADAVIAGLTRATSVINVLKVSPPEEFAGWVQVSPASFSEVRGNESRSFQLGFSVPEGLPPGVYSFSLDVLADSAILGSVPVTIIIGGVSLAPERIKSAKQDLIQELSAPRYEAEFLKARVIIPCEGCDYSDEELKVRTWLDSLPSTMAPGEIAAVHRLKVQEEAFKELLHAQAGSAHIGNTQAGHAIGLAISAHAGGKFVLDLVGKSVVGLLVTKIQAYIEAKLLAMVGDAILWFTQQLPPSPGLEAFRSSLRVVTRLFEEHVQNSLKKGTVKGKFLEKLLEDVVILPLDEVAIQIYVEGTRENLSAGLQKAREIAKVSTTMDEVRAQASYIEAQVAEVTHKVTQDQRVLQEQAEELAERQAFLKFAADASETVGALFTISGAGVLAGKVSFLVSLAIRAVDAAMAGHMMGKAYLLWYSVPNTAAEATRQAFGSPLPEASLVSDRRLGAATGYSVGLPERSEHEPPALGQPSDRTAGGEEAPEFPAHLQAHLHQVRTDIDTYISHLSQLADAVRSGDRASVERVAEDLLAADEALSESFSVLRQPVFAAAHAFVGDERFDSAYSALGRSATAFDGEGASLYLYLLAWLAEPKDEEARNGLLKQIETVGAETEAYATALERILPLVAEYAAEPSVLVTGYTLPKDLVRGQQATLSVEVFNPAPKLAEGVSVSLDVGPAASAAPSEATKTLDKLGGGQRHTLVFRFVPTQEGGLLAVSTSARNGSGSLLLIPFNAAPPPAPPPTLPPPPPPRSTPPSTVALFAVFLFLAGGGALGYILVSSLQRRETLSLLVIKGPARPARLPLAEPAVRIGRGPWNDLVVNDPKVSKGHCRIERLGDHLVLTDLGSVNGTFVNGEKVQQRVLQPGDVIRVGDAELILQRMAAQRF